MKRLLLVLLGLSTATIASPAHAIFNSVCEPDSQRYCLGLINEGTDVLLKCLRENEKKLMPACRAKIAPLSQNDQNKKS